LERQKRAKNSTDRWQNKEGIGRARQQSTDSSSGRERQQRKDCQTP